MKGWITAPSLLLQLRNITVNFNLNVVLNKIPDNTVRNYLFIKVTEHTYRTF